MKYNLELIKNKRKIISFSTFLILLSLLGILYSTFNTSYKKPINLGMDFVGGNELRIERVCEEECSNFSPDLVLEKLNEKNIKYIHNKNNDFEKIMVQEPSLNLIQLIKSNKVLDENYKKFINKSNWYIHHMNLESLDVRESVSFVSEYLDLKEGKWTAPKNKGDFSIDPSELSIFPMSSLNKGLHIIKPDDGFGFRNNFAHNPSIAGHPAFTVKDVKKVMDILGQSKILFSNAEIYAMPKFHQIYLYDLNANMLEINQEV